MEFGVFDKKVNKESELNGFILDGGTSFHITYRKDFLHNFQELNGSVSLGDNSVQAINEVFYIPELKRNLLSEAVLASKGMKIVKSQSPRISYNDDLVGVTLKGENIYHLQMQPLVNQ
ncbi:hypothetical protein ILUMI_16617, partial [Ignelater luminosus]